MNENFFTQKLASIMKDNMFDREIGGFRSGKLDTKSLHKVSVGSERVFKQRTERQNKRYSVIIMVDESGSMIRDLNDQPIYSPFGGIQIIGYGCTPFEPKTAEDDSKIALVAGFAEVLTKALNTSGIALSIVGYNAHINIHKSWVDGIAKIRNLKNDIIDKANDHSCPPGLRHRRTSCNHDLFAIEKVQSLFRGREGNKILVILTDGRPNCDHPDCEGKGIHYGGANVDKLKTLAHALSNEITILTVGIGTDEVEKHYPNCVTVNNKEEFMKATVDRLSALIKRG